MRPACGLAVDAVGFTLPCLLLPFGHMTTRDLTADQKHAIATIQALLSEYAIPLTDFHDVTREIEKARQAIRTSAIHQAQQLIAFWGIQPHEIRGRVHQVPVSAEIKYRHPLSGDTWSGEGTQPAWLKAALLKEGYRLAELRPGTPDHEAAALRAGQAA